MLFLLSHCRLGCSCAVINRRPRKSNGHILVPSFYIAAREIVTITSRLHPILQQPAYAGGPFPLLLCSSLYLFLVHSYRRKGCRPQKYSYFMCQGLQHWKMIWWSKMVLHCPVPGCYVGDGCIKNKSQLSIVLLNTTDNTMHCSVIIYNLVS